MSEEKPSQIILRKLDEIMSKLESKPEAKPSFTFKCRHCGYTTDDPQSYLEHVASSTIESAVQKVLKDALSKIDFKKAILECKDEICKIVEEVYDARRKHEQERREQRGWLW